MFPPTYSLNIGKDYFKVDLGRQTIHSDLLPFLRDISYTLGNKIVKFECHNREIEGDDCPCSRDSDFSFSGDTNNELKGAMEGSSTTIYDLSQSGVLSCNINISSGVINSLPAIIEKRIENNAIEEIPLEEKDEHKGIENIVRSNSIGSSENKIDKGFCIDSINDTDTKKEEYESNNELDKIENVPTNSMNDKDKLENDLSSLNNNDSNNIEIDKQNSTNSMGGFIRSESDRVPHINRMTIPRLQTYFVDSMPRIESKPNQVPKSLLSARLNIAQTPMSSKLALESNVLNSSFDTTDLDSYGDSPLSGSSNKMFSPSFRINSTKSGKQSAPLSSLSNAHVDFNSSDSSDDKGQPDIEQEIKGKNVMDGINLSDVKGDDFGDKVLALIEDRETEIPKMFSDESYDSKIQKTYVESPTDVSKSVISQLSPLTIENKGCENDKKNSILNSLDESNSHYNSDPDEIVKRLMGSVCSLEDMPILNSPSAQGMPGLIDSISDFDRSGKDFGSLLSPSCDSLGTFGADVDEILSRYKI